jgi:SAM-dependent methyltransferase
VATDEAPGDAFDLVHARLVLVHVAARDEALRRMISALAPGGWLVVEDFDTALVPAACLEATTVDQERANRIRHGFYRLLAGRGVDLEYGRKLPRLLREGGLEAVAADAYFPVTHPANRLLETANTAQVATALVEGGWATRTEIDDHLAALDRGELDIATPPLVSAWGRRPR